MAGGNKRGGGDRVLESRHLVGLFLGVVLLCGVFFTLGYVMGRTQYGGAVHAESPARNSTHAAVAPVADPGTSSSPSPSEWDFYAKKKGDDRVDAAAPAKDRVGENPAPAPQREPSIQPQSAPALVPVKAMAPAPPAVTKPNAKGSIVLQVAALTHQSDALAMAQVLQQKHFPAFVARPAAGDNLYRVQVGPYAEDRIADAAKAALDHDGFKAIIKH